MAIITGATGGIGQIFVRELTKELLDEIWVIGRNEDKLYALKKELGEKIVPVCKDCCMTVRLMLTQYAEQHGYENIEHYTDDGWTGTNFDRPDWKRMLADIEAGKVGTVIVKDMSRVGREYLQVGFYTEVMFRESSIICKGK